ncbi:pyruvate dehydrogenase complex dihydrolipoamide acetyltransferase [Ponticaulis sp.]|uniref:pyruvate dehydrogenase complex dihydrolipoamide acetyltransferase n=1 Tax=Ponticaulis sp. TaxID=2020902 RepID=UPI000B74F4B3|nr:pyruvate dehydrogenase complex dihydrolipoamide acetyltransferase [Ponticaulis sp.]MAI89414.1 pyruvate dehydrogenase complex dihydrolipoamide acetyltransferase [Ponticaulis sp.]OUY00453.1 MAG: pyruvate dehydrogenase complex dihydrolipoamide acetyltransferase [Hyphomonadaceae bacterium TMED5]|tara:strand:- start:59377 stop:60678 length:1302 start_codon:yes stop_codon:yes gene_type:complete
MAINITMPALSPTMEEGKLAKWLVKEGDDVASGDIIAEIETDKATMEVEAVDEGKIAKILVEAGAEGVKVNSVIAVLAEDGEDVSSVEVAEESSPKSEATDSKSEASPTPTPTEQPKEEAPKAVPSAGSGADRIKASPLARRIAAQKGVDLKSLKGSGPHGRIIKKDVEAAASAPKPAAAATASAGSPDGLILPQVLDDRIYDPESYELVPLDGMRKTVAKRLTTSFMQVPHFPLEVDIQLDKLLAARAGINAAAPEGVKVSVNDMLIKASALALMAESDCNSSYTDNGIAYHKSANISVAVAIDGGLITPVIRDAQTKGLREISEEMKDLATRARDRKLKPQEYTGGTFSISNLGMFGIKSFGSIINPPEGMIMSVGGGEKRAVVLDDGSLAARTVMSVTLTCDHRVIGGAEGAKWLQAFKRFVETPEAMLL